VKFNFFLIFFLLMLLNLTAQQITGIVLDKDTKIEIYGAYISSTNNSFSTKTDRKGQFTLPNAAVYFFSKEGYITQKVNITEKKTIELIAISESLSEIIIVSNNFKNKIQNIPTAISVLTRKDIQRNNVIDMTPVLNTIAGVFMHSGTLSTNRITIRGIGSRSPYNTSKIRAYYQDIPLTNGSGITTIEDIDMTTLGKLEILKGPSSSIYGAGLGGTLQLIPIKTEFNKSIIESDYTVGSFGLHKYTLKTAVTNNKNSVNLTYTNLHLDGYRANNKTDREIITITSNHDIGTKDKISFIGNLSRVKAFIPSSLNEDDYFENPSVAAYTWAQSKGFEEYTKGLLGVSWQHEYNSNTTQKTSVFSSFLNSYEPRPFNILKEETNGIGIRTRLIQNTTLFKNELNWTIGIELFNDANSYQTYKNLYNTVPSGSELIQGELLSNFKERRTYFNLFFDSKYTFSKKIHYTLGLNLNKTSYHLKDNLINNIPNFSGNYSFKTMISPKIGIVYKNSLSTMLYGSISHGFSPPTLEETLLPDGLINSTIEPESGWNYEIGSRGQLFKNTVYFDIAIYRMNVKNLLVARRTSNDEYMGVNAGKTQYNGLEFTLKNTFIKTKNITLFGFHSFAYNDFKFKKFIDDSNDYSNNLLTGVPKLTYNATIGLESLNGFYTSVNYSFVGEIPLRDDNSVYSDEYQIINTQFGYQSNTNNNFQYNFLVGINNLTNSKYASMLLINAGSFGGNKPRYYYPGNPVNYYTSLKLKYLF
jgi:iron complex outermembrane receptor protein